MYTGKQCSGIADYYDGILNIYNQHNSNYPRWLVPPMIAFSTIQEGKLNLILNLYNVEYQKSWENNKCTIFLVLIFQADMCSVECKNCFWLWTSCHWCISSLRQSLIWWHSVRDMGRNPGNNIRCFWHLQCSSKCVKAICFGILCILCIIINCVCSSHYILSNGLS